MKPGKIIPVLLLFISSLLKADDLKLTFDSANAAYSKGKYEQAIKLYENILSNEKESFSLYYNLGNAYLKNNELGKAILNYERAKKLQPDDEDLIANLKLANQRTEDKIDSAPKLFIAQWENGVTDLLSEKEWSISLIILLFAALVLLSIYFSSETKALRQIGFFGGSLLLILALFTFFMARNKYETTLNSSSAIILSPSVTVTSSPAEEGTKLFILHEGTKVNITAEEGDWLEIKIANGNVGWIRKSVISQI